MQTCVGGEKAKTFAHRMCNVFEITGIISWGGSNICIFSFVAEITKIT